MFERSLMESSGELHLKSSRYVWITATVNLTVVAVMMIMPLLYPEALPRTAFAALLNTPLPPPSVSTPPPQTTAPKALKVTTSINAFAAPATIPTKIDISREDPPATLSSTGVVGMSSSLTSSTGPAGALGLGAALPLVKVASPKTSAPTHISSGVIAGNKISGSSPAYPAIAKAAHVSGAVVMHAIISRAGTIQSLSVISGPEMLRASAISAVQDWKYKPYLLNGEPTEVDTTITVNFSFGG